MSAIKERRAEYAHSLTARLYELLFIVASSERMRQIGNECDLSQIHEVCVLYMFIHILLIAMHLTYLSTM